MKTILLALAIALAASGCKRCGTCTSTIITTTSVAVPNYPDTTVHEFDACDDELRQWDNDSNSTSVTENGITATSIARTTCVIAD